MRPRLVDALGVACDNNFLAEFIKPPSLFLHAEVTNSRWLGPVAPPGKDRASGSPRRFLLACGGGFLLLQTPYSQLGEALSEQEWQDL